VSRTADDGLRAWLALHRAPGIGPRTFLRLLEAAGDPQAALALPRQELLRLGLPEETCAALKAPDWAAVDADLRWLEQPGHHILRFDDPAYPARLRDIADPPPLLYVLGEPAYLAQPQLAVIGSRNPTAGGRDTAYAFAAALVDAGLCVTSGLALGIDAAAHRGALARGGPTIAVTGTGLDRVYPARHRDLAHAIAAKGALVSEFPLGTPPRADHFPRRNRIISGLSLGTLVVEASLHSGSLITARCALEQGREVFAIPGSIHNPLSKGCHALIRQGAKLVETVADILEELRIPLELALTEPAPATETAPDEEPLDEDYRSVLQALGHDPVPVEVLLQRTGLTPAVVSSILLALELRGYVEAAPGGRYARTGKKDA